jgi:hypothetical protein
MWDCHPLFQGTANNIYRALEITSRAIIQLVISLGRTPVAKQEDMTCLAR